MDARAARQVENLAAQASRPDTVSASTTVRIGGELYTVTVARHRPARAARGESTAALMRRTDPASFQHCRDAGRL